MKELVDTTEMYLRTIYELEEEGIPPLRARIVERLEQSGPTVSQTVGRMERDNLLAVEPNRRLKLTPEGRKRATAVMRKHRLAERLLYDVIGLDIDKVHDEACRWEHVMSDDVEEKLVAVLSDVSESPFGNPIPGLDNLDTQEAGDADVTANSQTMGVRIVDLPQEEEVAGTLAQLHEIVQVHPSLFRRFCEAKLRPGDALVAINHGSWGEIRANDSTIDLPEEVVHAVRIFPENA